MSNPKTYEGSCVCGAVRFQAVLDLAAGTTRCNCTICTKTAWWGAICRPAGFRLIAGEDSLGDWTRNPAAHSRFCRRCGVRTHGDGDIPELGGPFVAVNLNTLDGVDLAGVTIRYLDGLHDTWAELGAAPYVSPFGR